jgi:glycosyltransferase involved in cell wall biosynthesis
MALKIGLVSGEFPPMEGGVGAFTRELAIALNESGHEVHVITDRRARPEGSERDFWNPRDPHGNEYAQIHPRANRWWWAANGAVVDVALRYDLDIVNIQYQAAAYDMRVPAINFLPWRMREVAPTVVTFHDLRYPYLFPKAGRLRNWIVHMLARSAEGVITTNAEDQDTLLNLGVDRRSMAQIPIGSNVTAHEVEASSVNAVRQGLGLTGDDCLLGYFGFINASKGPDILLQTLAKLGDRYHLVFIGGKLGSSDASNARYLAQIEAMIGDLALQDRVHWSGFLEEETLSGYLGACDMMVMPYRDGVSLRRGTLMAILAHGRPLITTPPHSDGAPLIHGQNVWLTPVDDPEALREAIKALAKDADLRQRLGHGARQVSEQFTWGKIAAKTADFYQVVIDG